MLALKAALETVSQLYGEAYWLFWKRAAEKYGLNLKENIYKLNAITYEIYLDHKVKEVKL